MEPSTEQTMENYTRLAIQNPDDLLFGTCPRPLHLKNGMVIGGGTVYPELNFTLPVMAHRREHHAGSARTVYADDRRRLHAGRRAANAGAGRRVRAAAGIDAEPGMGRGRHEDSARDAGPVRAKAWPEKRAARDAQRHPRVRAPAAVAHRRAVGRHAAQLHAVRAGRGRHAVHRIDGRQGNSRRRAAAGGPAGVSLRAGCAGQPRHGVPVGRHRAHRERNTARSRRAIRPAASATRP